MMKKRWLLFLILAAILIIGFVACSGGDEHTSGTEQEPEKTEDTNNGNETAEKNTEKEKPLHKKVKLDDEYIFEYFVINMNQAKFYEKKGKAFMDLSFDWKNNFGEQAKFIRAGSVFAYQGENDLEEITNAYSDTSSHVHFPNAAGGTWSIKLTYELTDKETPVKVVFMSHESEKKQELEINFK